MPDDYYTSQADRLLSDFDAAATPARPILASWYAADAADQVLGEARDRFGALIPQLPYVGGGDSAQTEWLVSAAQSLAIYQAMKSRGRTVKDVGELLYLAVQAQFRESPPLRPEDSERSFRQMIARARLTDAQARVRPYAEGWVGALIEGKAQEFDFGIDWTECGICKFLHAHEADELAPYLCLTDFVQSKARGWGLQRTMTLAEGHAKCDFRFKLGRETSEAWPPRFLRKRAGVRR